MGSDSERLMLPTVGAWAVLFIDPVASLEHLEDPEATLAAANLANENYVVYIMENNKLFNPTNSHHEHRVSFLLTGDPSELPEQFIDSSMILPILPTDGHLSPREPLRPSKPLPWPNCYLSSFIRADIRIRPPVSDANIAVQLLKSVPSPNSNVAVTFGPQPVETPTPIMPSSALTLAPEMDAILTSVPPPNSNRAGTPTPTMPSSAPSPAPEMDTILMSAPPPNSNVAVNSSGPQRADTPTLAPGMDASPCSCCLPLHWNPGEGTLDDSASITHSTTVEDPEAEAESLRQLTNFFLGTVFAAPPDHMTTVNFTHDLSIVERPNHPAGFYAEVAQLDRIIAESRARKELAKENAERSDAERYDNRLRNYFGLGDCVARVITRMKRGGLNILRRILFPLCNGGEAARSL
ncbi:hypothetical protein C8J57DRAFT_1312914 [Mycena rebaudengoi]|nr:hypothetical protein C8J57DRAFT_1312914 [Mycena rebaudengoi]